MRLRNRLKKMRQWVMRPGVLLTLVVVLLALFVWFVGPYLGVGGFAPLSSVAARLAVLLLLAILWGAVGFAMRQRRTSDEEALIAALRRQENEAAAAADKEQARIDRELEGFRIESRRALALLNRGRSLGLLVRPRYTLPWYMILGREGSGRTSLVHASGLTIAPDDDAPDEAPAARFHVCEQAVLIELSGEIAGKDDATLRSLWAGFLQHIRRLRARQPINGFIITVSVDELLDTLPEDRAAYAGLLRRRLDEAVERLRANAPIYIVVTKADRIVGFEEILEDLTAEERAAAFGIPIAPDLGGGDHGAQQALERGFTVLAERIGRHQFTRMEEEPDELQRRRIFEFPAQFAQLRDRLEPFVQQLAAVYRFGAAANIRGVFFVSARQTGDSADLLAAPLAGRFFPNGEGLALGADRSLTRLRPFFLFGLFRNAILPEADLGGLTRPARVANWVKDLSINVALGIGALVLLALWWFGFSDGRLYASSASDRTEKTRALIASTVTPDRQASEFAPVLDVLDHLRYLAEAEPESRPFGLYDPGEVRGAARDVYDRAVSNLFFPFVWRYLKQGLVDPSTPAALRFNQLKLYLMLTGTKPVDGRTAALLGPDFAARWMLYDRSEEIDRRVSEHFSRLAEAALPQPSADQALVDLARGRITDYSLARLAYDQALLLPPVKALEPWRPVDHMGLAGPEAMARRSGTSFYDGIPGAYTKAGLPVMMKASGEAAAALGEDFWVMGSSDNIVAREREAGRVRDGLLDIYRVDYMSHWDTLLSDLDVAGGEQARSLAGSIAIISANPSPARDLLTAIAEEVDLQTSASDIFGSLQDGAAAQIAEISKTARAPRRVVNVPKSVTDHFQPFRDAVVAIAEGQQTPVDDMLAALQPLYAQLNHVATGGDVLELGAEPQTLIGQLSDRNAKLPPIVQPFFARILAYAGAITGGSSRARLAEIWTSTVLPLCTATTQGRYPFDPGSAAEASLDDFGRLLGPKGAIASFRETYLKPYIDSSSKPWRWRKGQQIGLGFSEEVLAEFEKADDLSTLFFGGQDSPNAEFVVEVGKLDPRARAFLLDIGGTVASYTHGPATANQYKWPPEDMTKGAAMSMTPELEGQRNIITAQGNWAVFRLFDNGRKIEEDPTDVVTYVFRLGQRSALLRVTAPATRNPFALDLVREFRCPQLQ